jgi:hypothetical protein
MTTVAQHIRSIQVRIETIAEKESHPGETGASLDETLAALTEAGRRRVAMPLRRPFVDGAGDFNHLAGTMFWPSR